ncbi:MAG: AgmX/PglI C-terminal domain-containing protein [Proteobacteria bacterium]|nr:AgmX/PglI C-terminal domain-containing protein [Pseudomonadota bacterium]
MNPRALVLAVLAVLVVLGAMAYLRSPTPTAPTPAPTPASVDLGVPDGAPPNSEIPFERARSATRSPSAGSPDRSGTEAARAAPPRPEPVEDDDDTAEPDPTLDDPEPSDPNELRTIWSVDPQGIDAAVREALPQLRECYQAWLNVDPDIGGRVLFEIVIDVPQDGEAAEDGTPLAAITELGIADTTVEHPMMESCALNVFSDLWFSPPDNGPVKVTYPVVLAAAD